MQSLFPVYVVDDDTNFREWMQMLLEEQGYEQRMFAGGEEFLAAYDSLVPGCILLDMRMPRRTGLQVQAELVRRGNRLPVIAITGYGDVDVAVRSMKLGALDFLEKPFSNDVLLSAIALAFQQIEGAHPGSVAGGLPPG